MGKGLGGEGVAKWGNLREVKVGGQSERGKDGGKGSHRWEKQRAGGAEIRRKRKGGGDGRGEVRDEGVLLGEMEGRGGAI